MPARLSRSRRESDSPTMARCLEAFTLALDAGGRSPKTLAVYREAVLQCADVLGNPPLNRVTAEDVQRFLVALRDRGLKPATLHNRYRALRTFFGWAEREELVARSPMLRVLAPTVPEREPPGYTADELVRLVAACNPRTSAGARDRAIFLTLVGTGLRVSELLSLTKGDIRREGLTTHYLRVVGKGNRERLVVLPRRAREAIAAYLLRRGDDDEPALWLGERGPLTRFGVFQICRRRGRQANVPGCHPHRFRNAAASLMLASGLDVLATQRILGHRSITMTERYARHNEERRSNDALLALDPLETIPWSGLSRKG